MTTWNTSYSRDIDATPHAIWTVLSDTATWTAWNDGVTSIQIEGPFASGTHFAMALPDGEIINSQLTSVVPEQHFVDETRLGEIVVRVTHRIEAISERLCRVTYAVEVQGPDAQAVGEAVSGDFPAVLEKLEVYVAQQAGA